MNWLNYHHLYYFWLVAREGSIAMAAEQLQLAHPTISKQLHQLEASFEDKLFDRVDRNLVLTEFGQAVFRYAYGDGSELHCVRVTATQASLPGIDCVFIHRDESG